jgi:YVTN family beta-propeller protein
MKAWVLGVVIILAVCAAGCGGNSTAISVTVTGPTGTSPISTSGGYPVPPNGAVQLLATVSGITATTVYWQVCLQPGTPPTTGSPTPVTPPADCSAPSAPQGCIAPTVSKPVTGYGTVTPNGLYTAPATIPSPSTTYAVATSCVNTFYFAVFQIVVKSPYAITITPSAATIATGQTFQFNATVQGPNSSSGVTWSVCTSSAASSNLNCGASGIGTISGSGLYTAPGTVPTSSVTVQATSVADPTQNGTAIITVVAATAPVLNNFSTSYPSPIAPTIAAAGSAQQDIYVNGSNFLSTEEVFIGPAGQAPTAVPTLFLSTTLLRATIPAAQLASAGTLQVSVQTPNGTLASPTVPFTLFPTRPALISELPDSVLQGSSNANVNLTGGFFSAATANATTVTFNGAPTQFALSSSRRLTATLQGSALQTEGLFPIVVQNAGVASGAPFMAGMNFAVTPTPSAIGPGPAVGSIPVGANPTAVAIDKADGWALVADTGANTVSVVSLATNAVISTYTVGNQPTGVAVDDQLPDPVALVVNSADQTVTAIDLRTGNTATLSVTINSGPNPPLPYSVGINPDTAQPVPGAPLVHRALVAYQTSNQAMVLDVSDPGGAGATPALSIVQTLGSTSAVSFSSGQFPAVAIDPRLNWAMVTPGGSGSFGVIDLGRDPVAGVDVGRAPQVIAGMAGSVTIQGIGVDSETHEVLLSDPNLATGNLAVFSPLDESETTVTNPCTPSGTNTCTGTPFNGATFGAAAVNPLTDVGVAVAPGNAVVVNLASAVVLQNITGIAGSSAPQAVAVDPVLNEAVVVNSTQNSVSILSLGGALNPMQIVGSSPSTTFTSSAPVTLTVTGNFATGSTVRLDQQALATTPVAASCNGTVCRQLTATVPATMLASARRFAVDVQAPSLAVSNIENFTVVQAIPVTCISGQTPCNAGPVGVAVDPDRDLAVVTNANDGSASLISIASGADAPLSLGPIGQLPYSPVQVGSSPAGVAVFPRGGVAIVANTGSNNVTAIDETGINTPATITLCGSNATSGTECVAPDGVAINGDTASAVVTNTNPSSTGIVGSISTFGLSPLPTSASFSVQVDLNPVAAAVDPNLDYAAVATASGTQTSSVEVVSLLSQSKVGDITGNGVFQNPSGIIFDPLNQVFLAADSALNEIGIVDPNTLLSTQVATGAAPTSLDYNYQTSTLVTVNGPTRTMSIMAYVCPPSPSAPNCSAPQVRSVLALGGSQNSSTVLGPSAVAIDPKLNLAVVVDPDNSRVLLVPLPQ